MSANLRSLEKIVRQYGDGAAARKRELLAKLDRQRLGSAPAVLRLHEILCFLRAYPDDRAVLGHVERMLAGFDARADLRRHRESLRDSGVAGTPIVYGFFSETAKWLATKWPQLLTVEWSEVEDAARIERALPLLALFAETPGLDEWAFPVRDWIGRMKGDEETDATFLVRRLAAIDAEPFARQHLYEDTGLVLRLSPGPDSPARSRAKLARPRIHWQRGPLDTARPDVVAELRRRPRSVRPVSRRTGERIIDLAREAMVTRSRDLDAFAYGDPDDVRLVDVGDGLEFALVGVKPERRLLLEAVYAFLTLKNGVPIGYVLNSALFGSAEIAYNVFDTYRGAEAGPVYGRVLAVVHDLFGADTFTIYPYQLGHENDEALESGAWWFYQKLGFRARDRRVLALMERELTAMRRDPGHRSSIETLRQLSTENVYLHTGRRRDDVIGRLPLADVGLAVTRFLAGRFGSDREEAARVCTRETIRRLGPGSLRNLSPAERAALERWAPLVACLPGLDRWTVARRRALARVIRAKGGRRESDFVRLFDAHQPLRRAIRRLARSAAT